MSSAALVHLLEGLTCCAVRDAFLHASVVASGYLTLAFLSSRTSLAIHL